MKEIISNQEDVSVTLKEIRKWNWGAFLLTWIWGIGNKSYVAFLSLIPIVNLIVPFYLGIKGNELAWENKYWYDINEFKHTQRVWAIVGWCIAILIFSMVGVKVKRNIDYNVMYESVTQQVMDILNNNDEFKELMGEEYDVYCYAKNCNNNTYYFTCKNENDIVIVYAFIDDNNIVKRVEYENKQNNIIISD